MLTSLQRRLLREQGADDVLEIEPEAPEAVGPGVKPETPPEGPEGDAETGLGDEPHTADESHKVEKTIEAIKKLQDAAVGLEKARFTIANEYSDFSLAAKLEALKSELVALIGTAKEHVMKSSSKSPEAEELVSKWLK